MTPDEQRITSLLQALIATLRSRTNQGIASLGLCLSSGSASLLSIVVVGFLALNLFLYLNITLGFLLGSLSDGSPALGFLMLAGVYVLLILVYLLIRSRVERRVRNRVARQVVHVGDNVNAELDTITQLRVDEGYREAYISGEPEPYHALELRQAEAMRKARHSGKEVQREFTYILQNYKAIALNAAESQIKQRYPAYQYVSSLASFLVPRETTKSKGAGTIQEEKYQRLRKRINRFDGALRSIRPYMPYINLAYQIVKPVATALLIGKTQGWLLSLLGMGKTRRR